MMSGTAQYSTKISTVLLRDVKNYIYRNRCFLGIEIGVFLIAAMISDMQLPAQCRTYGILDNFILLFRGIYPFTGGQGDVFQLPMSWFVLLYLCVCTSLFYPVHDVTGFGLQILLHTNSRKQWWSSKYLALMLWNILYFLIGFAVLIVFRTIKNGGKIEWISASFPLWTISFHSAILLCLLPVLFGLLLSSVCLFASIFFSFAWGQIIGISILIIVAFTETPIPFGSYSMTIRCNAITAGGVIEWHGIVLYLALILLVFFVGQFSITQKDFISKSEVTLYEN